MSKLKKWVAVIALVGLLAGKAKNAFAEEDAKYFQKLSRDVQVSLERGNIKQDKIKEFARAIAKLKNKRIRGVNIPLNMIEGIRSLAQFYNHLEYWQMIFSHDSALRHESWIKIVGMMELIECAEGELGIKLSEEREALKEQIRSFIVKGEQESMKVYGKTLEQIPEVLFGQNVSPLGGYETFLEKNNGIFKNLIQSQIACLLFLL